MSKTAEPSEVTPTGQVERPGAGETRALVESFAAIGASNDLNRTADQVLAGLRALFRCDSATIAIKVLGEGTEIVGHRTRSDGKADRDRPRAEVGKGIVGRVLETGKAALFSVVEEGSPVSSERRPGELRPATRSAMAAPIVGGSGRLLGALLLESNEAGRYDNDALETLMSFGRASAAAVERSLLYAQVLDDERRLEGEMEVARQVMAGILPSETPKLAGFDVAAVIEPCYEVGGDYYDFIRLVDDRWGIAMADVSGKGVPAALVVAAMRATLYTLAKRELALRSVFRYANEFINTSTRVRAKYVTLFYAVLDVQARRMIYVNAGHLPPVVLRASGDVDLLRSGGFPLGFFDAPRYFEQFAQLSTGDLVCLYTDGITETSNAKDEDYGRARLIEVLRRHQQRSAAEIADAILSDVRRFGERAPLDDATVLILKAT
ncbi:MAG TPA: GAF domain-containing SpoIIE family protein phosphatase [Vicinamibacteria bacterium]|nr:GAF domain-containing SpoIIE family protein phosphatase [Vicinamibacteria bacterium]